MKGESPMGLTRAAVQNKEGRRVRTQTKKKRGSGPPAKKKKNQKKKRPSEYGESGGRGIQETRINPGDWKKLVKGKLQSKKEKKKVRTVEGKKVGQWKGSGEAGDKEGKVKGRWRDQRRRKEPLQPIGKKTEKESGTEHDRGSPSGETPQ